MPLKPPVDRRTAFGGEDGVGLGEVAAAEEGAAGEGRRVSGLQDDVFAGVDKGGFGAGVIAPEHEDYALATV